MDKEIKEAVDNINVKLDYLKKVVDERFDKLKKVVGDYLDLTSNIALASVKTSLKSV